MESKECLQCKINKSLKEFSKHKGFKSGYNSRCKECKKQYSKQRYETHSHVWKEWNDNNKNKVRINTQKWKDNNVEKYKEYQKNYILKYSRDQYQNNLEYKLQKILRSRFYQAIKKEYKNTSILNLTGCSIDELKKHIESQFDNNMNWENYGSYWEIDHIEQINKFDLKIYEQQQKCFHYSNLRPLEKIENKKRKKK
jgi:hypothetical protein